MILAWASPFKGSFPLLVKTCEFKHQGLELKKYNNVHTLEVWVTVARHNYKRVKN